MAAASHGRRLGCARIGARPWVGYKLHIDVADGQIPISCLLTAASLHDSQAAIPLATLSAERSTNLYDVMDAAAYDAQEIREHSRSLNHVPLIDINTRRNTTLKEERNAKARRRQVLAVAVHGLARPKVLGCGTIHAAT